VVVVEQQLLVDSSASSDLRDASTRQATPRKLVARGDYNA